MGIQSGYYYTKGKKEPAHIFAWRWLPMMFFWGVGGALAVYGKFIKGYSMLWLVGPFVPLWMYLFYNVVRQPQIELENGYKYIIAKRAATCEMEINTAKWATWEKSASSECKALGDFLAQNNMTLYQLEQGLLDRMTA